MKEETKYRLRISIPIIIIVLTFSWVVYHGWKDSIHGDIEFHMTCSVMQEVLARGDIYQVGKPYNQKDVYYRICVAKGECSSWTKCK